MNLSEYNRIAIIGCPGSGKSALARQIACLTGHPLIHLDFENWQPGWVQLPKDEFIAKQHEWVKGERWLIDGNYQSSMEIRFAAADLVIFLDFSRTISIWRIFKRRKSTRPDLKPGIEDKDNGIFSKIFMDFLMFAWQYRKKSRPQVFALHEQYPGVEFLRLGSRKAVKALLCAQCDDEACKNALCSLCIDCLAKDWDNPDDEVWNDI